VAYYLPYSINNNCPVAYARYDPQQY